MDFSEKTPKGADKIARYDWKLADEPGELQWISKHSVLIDDVYQRALIEQRVVSMSQKWSWIACGTLIVGNRDGQYWAIDGQHRLMAAKRRSDIQDLPCIVFRCRSVKEEAKGFLSVNSERKPISVRQRHKAMVVAGDNVALMIQQRLNELGLSTTVDDKTPGFFACFAWARRAANDDYGSFCAVLGVAAEISIKDSIRIKQTVVEGLSFIDKNYTGGVLEPRIHDRIKAKGAFALDLAAKKCAALAGGGGSKVWAKGMVDELNRGLQKKFRVQGLN